MVQFQHHDAKGASVAGDELLHTKQVEQQYGINAGTLRFWRSTNQGPASFTLGRRGRVVYRRSEVERWLTEQETTTRRGGGDLVR
jgi:predicted DNA-binding transcriptional regulator AlpA